MELFLSGKKGPSSSGFCLSVKDGLLYALAAFYPLMVFSVVSSRDSIPFWIVIIMVVVSVGEMIRRGGVVWVDRSQVYLFLLLVFYALGYYLVLIDDSPFVWLGRTTSERAEGTIIRMAYVFVAFSVFVHFLLDAPYAVFQRILKLQVYCGVVVALLGILQYVMYVFFGSDVLSGIHPTNETFGKGAYYLQHIGETKMFRAAAFFKEPSSFGFFIVPIMTKLVVARANKVSFGSTARDLTLLGVYILAIVASPSLTAVFSLAVLGIFWLVWRIVRRPSLGLMLTIIGGLLFAVVLFVVVGPALENRIQNVFQFRDASTIDRAARMAIGVEVFEENPWFGVGPGIYAFWYPRYGGLDAGTMATPLNIWLNILTDVGIVGFLAFACFLFRILSRALKAMNACPLIPVYFWSVVSYLVLLSTTDIWYIEIVWFEFALLVGLSSKALTQVPPVGLETNIASER